MGSTIIKSKGLQWEPDLGPTTLDMGHIEGQIFQQYTGAKPDLYKRYIVDIAGAFSGGRNAIEEFATFVNDFHPSVKFTWSVSDKELPFLDHVLKSTSDRLTSSIQYKPTDTHSYRNYASSHPIRCKYSIPHSQFLRLLPVCTGNEYFDVKSKEMANFFRNRGYPQNIVDRAHTCILARPRVAVIASEPAADIPPAEHSTIPLVLTYHPTNQLVKYIISRNFHFLRDDPDTAAIFQPLRILCAYLYVIRTCGTI